MPSRADQPHAVLVFDQAGGVEHAADGRAQRTADAVLLGRLHRAISQRHEPFVFQAAPAYAVGFGVAICYPASTLNQGPAQPKPPFCSSSGPAG